MPVPNIFGSATSAIPLSQLDTNFATPVTIGNTAVQLGNTVTSFGNVTLTNVTISSGNVTVSAGSNTAPSITTVGDTNTGIFFPAADTIAFSEGGVEAMRIDSSGNVGIGTSSPSASYKMSITGNSASIYSGILFTDTNAGGGVFSIYGESAALKFRDSSAGATRMTINSAGNVGMGTTSPQAVLDLGDGTGGKAITWGGSTGIARYTSIFSTYGSGSLAFGRGFTGSTSADSYVSTYTGTIANCGIRLDSSGFINFFTDASSSQTAGNAFTPTPRMRIDSSGNLLVGQTAQTSAEKFGVTQSASSGQGAYFYLTNASYAGSGIIVNTARAANTAFDFFNAYANAVLQFSVGGTGVIYSASLTGGATTLSVNAGGSIIRTPSDASLKTNIQPITYGLDTVMKLKPIKHEWVEEINMGAPSIGFIAQDMELEVPEVVSGEEYKSIDYPKLTAVLTKAIQEQQAIITQLQADVAALKGTA